MNTDKLRELVDRIHEAESKIDTQGNLSNLVNALNNLVSQPQNADYQTTLSQALKKFASSMQSFEHAFSPRDYLRVIELSEDAFSPTIPHEIEQAVLENAMTPNVVSEMAQKVLSKRKEVFNRLKELRGSLEYFDFGYVEPEDGKAEVGFQIPRDLFENNLPGFIKELREIERITKFFSEAAIGQYDPAEVGSISTTDPLIFLAMAEPVAKYIAGAVVWALGVWYSVEKIRNLRAQTAQLQSFTPKEVEDFFDSKIKTEIETAVARKVEEVLADGQAPARRKGELTTQLTWALESILAKVERGMTIELRIAPPPIEDEEPDPDEPVDPDRGGLLAIQEKLVFPKPSDNPVLAIPELKDEKPPRAQK
ncbi:hypothetical protein [Tabrizicola fusiformis]|uniref:hypothetical protein n=1 Tax=Tabrizicola sp. SY72 TaxID=2741673 RepID=UPI001571C929|nr:hypothetical protein [Tabrizicola sp. SY72]NTT87754.1 hypothetical protein [Tabrizicola sp. SY72]